MPTFAFDVNGKPASVTLDNEETPLLAVLRDELGLMGTRFGCGLEQCGCCMVLIDGAPEKCCTKPVWSIAGKSVITIASEPKEYKIILITNSQPSPICIP